MLKRQIDHLNVASNWLLIIVGGMTYAMINRLITIWRLGEPGDAYALTIGLCILTLLPLCLCVMVGFPLKWLLVKVCPGYKSCYIKDSNTTGDAIMDGIKSICAVVLFGIVLCYRQSAGQFEFICNVVALVEFFYVVTVFLTAVSDVCATVYEAIKLYVAQLEPRIELLENKN